MTQGLFKNGDIIWLGMWVQNSHDCFQCTSNTTLVSKFSQITFPKYSQIISVHVYDRYYTTWRESDVISLFGIVDRFVML